MGNVNTNILERLRQQVQVSATDDDDFRNVVERLSAQSLVKRYDAYEDIPWDDPDYQITDGDPRMRLWSVDPLRRTDWYRNLPDDEKSAVATHRIASNRRILADVTPLVLGIMAPLMVYPSAKTMRDFAVPAKARRQMKADPETQQLLKDSVAKIRNQFGELALIDFQSRLLWKLVGLWDEANTKVATD